MKALVIDDEPMPAKDLAFMIDKYCNEITSVEISLSASEALRLVKEKYFNVLFLDIEMPEMTGFEFIELARLSREVGIIITTAYEQYALKAFDANAIHYLVKPVKASALIKAVWKVQQNGLVNSANTNQDNPVISVFDHKEHHIVYTLDIIRLEADGNYTKIVLKDQTLLSCKAIGSYNDSLPQNVFFRTHRSHIINVRMIQKMTKGKAGLIFLSNGDQIPYSKGKYEALVKTIGI